MNPPRTVGYDDFVDQRIQKTRGAVKSADLITGLVTLFAWALGLLLLAAAADHWLVAGGFDRWGRFALFAIGLVGALLYVGTRLGPALLGRVNPLYAAQQIERESPQLKNSLLNLLQLRGRTAGSPAAVQRTLERQAAERLAAAGETAIDRSELVRVARVVMVLVAAIGVYVVASPKDFFASAGRVLAPWADIAAPSRVRIETLEPGDAELAQGDRLAISAMVTGLRDEELVEIVYSTSDGRVVDRRVPMIASSTQGVRHTLSLPPGGGSTAALGLQGDLSYRLEAGDARTRNYRVEVLAAPTIAPVSVTYDYPKYTGYSRREVEGVGDLRAIEGTRVTITADANLPIDSAQIDLGADGRPDVRMQVNKNRATGPLTLRRDPQTAGDSTTSYVLRFTSTDNQANNSPPQYRVEVLADLPPEAAILLPEESVIEVAVDRRVRIEVEARDPDFALKGVRLIGEKQGRRVLDERLLSGAAQGRFTAERFVTPSELGLQPGEVLEYWVEAIDNKTPQANRVETEHKRLRVLGPAQDAPGGAGEAQQQPRQGEGQPQPGQNADPDAGESGQQGGERGQQGKQPSGGSQNQSGDPSEQGDQQQDEAGEQPDSEDQQGKDGRKPSPGGLRAPGEGGGSGDEEDESQNPGTNGESGESSDESGGSPAGSGSSSQEGDDQQAGQQDGEPGDSSGDRGQKQNESGQGDPNGGQQQGGGEQDGSGEGKSDAPVPRNGEDDATAFERIREFLNNQKDSGQGREADRRRQPGESNPGESGDQQQDQSGRRGDPSERPNGEGQRSEADPGDQRDGSASEPGDNRQGDPREGSDNSNQRPRDGEAGQQADRSETGEGPGERDRSGQQSDSTNSESGGDTPPGESTDPQAGPREGTGSAGQNQAADRGAGQSADQGAGDTSGRPGGQQQADGPTGESGGEQPGDGSQSSAGGDQSGGDSPSSEQQPGGEQGDPNGEGQSPGGEQAGDQGDTSQGQAGDQQDSSNPNQSGGKNGEQGQPRESSDSNNSQNNEQASGEQRDGGKPSDQESGSKPNGKKPSDNTNGQAGESNGRPTGQGTQQDSTGEPGEGTEIGGDEANLDYAREQTELVLEELEEQLREREVDRKLLDKLGWTEQDLKRFVERWQSRRQKAAERGSQGSADLDRALRNLGLNPNGAKATRTISDDKLRDLRERARQAIPPRLRQATEAYNKSLNALSDDPASGGDE